MLQFLIAAAAAAGTGIAFEVGGRGIGATLDWFTNADEGERNRAMAMASLRHMAGLQPLMDETTPGGLDLLLGDFLAANNPRVALASAAGVGSDALALRDLVFGRANQLRAAAVRLPPSPLELMAGMKGLE